MPCSSTISRVTQGLPVCQHAEHHSAAMTYTDTNCTRLEFVKDIKRHVAQVKYISRIRENGPVMENVSRQGH